LHFNIIELALYFYNLVSLSAFRFGVVR